MAAPPQPSWFEHVDLMQIVIAALVSLVGLLLAVGLKVGFSLLMTKMDEMCKAIDGKADDEDLRKAVGEHVEMWRRINHHSHEIDCGQASCKPKCGKVIISEGPS